MFTHLHTHSDFSLLHGLAKIDDLLAAAQKNGMTALALTDKNAVYGAVEFTVKAKDYGIKPIIGAEILVAPGGMMNKENTPSARKTHQLVLLAQNEIGYKNLLKIITAAQLDGMYFVPRVDYDVLRAHANGLIALSGGATGEIGDALANNGYDKAREKALLYANIFGKENFFLELNNHPDFPDQKKINDGLIALSAQTDVPLVACGDVYYIDKSDRDTHEVLLCIQMNRKVDEVDRPTMRHLDLSFHTEKDMREAFAAVPDAVDNAQKIADRCTFTIDLGHTKLPYFPLPKNTDADTFLRDLCEAGLTKKFGTQITSLHRQRLDYELDVIKKTGYASYFLIVQDFVNWAKNDGIVVGPGRGSAAGSFVAYLTGITNMDPIEYKLLFERFLNPERVSMPDVDMDFSDDRRDDVIAYVRRLYGADHVAQIITFGTMAARAAIRDAGRALGLPYNFCDQIAKLIPEVVGASIDDALKTVPDFKRLHKENDDAAELIDTARRLEGLCRHSSIHACGVVITDKPVVEYTAMQRVAGDDQATVTQYASSTKFSAVEKIGLLKMDFLGLKNLTIIQNTLRIIKKIHSEKVDIEQIPLDDARTYALLQRAHTTGVFQLESGGMKRYLKQLKPTVLEDIIAMVALYRPGPMEWIPDFIAGKHGTKTVTYLHPKLEAILADTYGVAVYQEQVMRIAQDLAGFTLGEADILRKAMGKKIIELIKEQKIKFIDGCVAHGITKDVAEKVFAFIEPFAGYGFNRSHAACYGLIGYQTAYLKAHYPAEFMAALMTSDQGHSDRIAIEAAECRDMGITVLPPDVNESFEEFAVIYAPDDAAKKQPRIRFGLNAIKNVGRPVAHEIVEERKRGGKYRDLSDFCTRVGSKDLNKKSLEALAIVGAFDSFADRDDILASMDKILTFIKDLRINTQSKQHSLFGAELLSRATIQLVTGIPSGKSQHLAWEKQLLGLYVSDHPAFAYSAFLDHVCVGLDVLGKDADQRGKTLTIGGVVIAVKTILTKSGATMAFVTVEDGKSTTEVIVFPKLLDSCKDLLTEGRAIVVTGTLSDKDEEVKFLANTLEEIATDKNDYAKSLVATRKKYKHTPTPDPDGAAPCDTALPPAQDTPANDDTPAHSDSSTSVTPNTPSSLTIILPPSAGIDTIEKIKTTLDTCTTGPTTVFLRHNGQTMRTAYTITTDTACMSALATIVEASSLITA